jgi:GGDEF domain-containing protein
MSQAGHRTADPSLEVRTLREEHEQLVSENLEYMGVLSRYARGLGLCSTLALEPLADRIVEGLCLETRAQGGLLWAARDAIGGPLRLTTVRGVVKPGDEPELLSAEDPPPGLEAVRESGSGAFAGPVSLGAGAAGAAEALYVRLRHAGRLLAVVRVSDRLDAAGFEARDLAAAEQFAEIAALALANALRFRSLEQSSLRDPRTHAYTPAFFEGVVATELEKAHRFGRHFSLLEIELSGLATVRQRFGEADAALLVDTFAERLQQALRGTDICAVDGESRYRLLLAETDALGAAALKRRIRGLGELLWPAETRASAVPALRLAAATFPGDGARLDDLTRCLARRLEEETRSLARVLEREARSFAESRMRLLREGALVSPQLPEQALRFVLEEVRRRAHERALVWVCPGADLHEAALDELSRLRGRAIRAEIVLLSDEDPQALLGIPVTCLSRRRSGARGPFLVYLGEAPAYACLSERDGDAAPFFHSSDRELVEHLAFQLQRELGQAPAA